jgi:hypothetical protein
MKREIMVIISSENIVEKYKRVKERNDNHILEWVPLN